MKCPHCITEIHDDPKVKELGRDDEGAWTAETQSCPACGKLIVRIGVASYLDIGSYIQYQGITGDYWARPQTISRTPPPPEVPHEYAADYIEAASVIGLSSQASAALSRRCLQHLLHDVVKIRKRNLFEEIEEFINTSGVPSHISDAVDAIRNIGNFAAHPIKSTSSGEISRVEPGEAEWNLEVLEALFDYLFVQPSKLKLRRDALNKKLADSMKPPLKDKKS